MKAAVWPRAAGGLLLGAAVSFLVGCVHAYAVWDPPSNDWGNEKTTTTILLIPLLLVALPIVFLARKPLGRGFARLRALGRVGVLAAVIGAMIAPLAEWGCVAAEWLAVRPALAIDRAANLARLGDIAARLREADAVVVENQSWMTRRGRDSLAFRLAMLTRKPVFVVEDNADRSQAKQLHAYRIAADPPCATPPIAEPACLIGTDTVAFVDWPASGALLYLDEDLRLTDDVRVLYGVMRVAALAKPMAAPTSPYAMPYDPGISAGIVWTNSCSIKNNGPFPFGRGIHWKVCAEPLSLDDAFDHVFRSPPLPVDGRRG